MLTADTWIAESAISSDINAGQQPQQVSVTHRTGRQPLTLITVHRFQTKYFDESQSS